MDLINRIKASGFSRYCFAALNLDTNMTLEQQVESARELIQQTTKALWFFREIGAYIVFHTDASDIHYHSEQLPIDRTGLHAVIVQGVHIIGQDNLHIFNHSKWLNHTFGKAHLISAHCRKYQKIQ